LADDEYYVYVGITDNATAPAAGDYFYRSPGTVKLSGMGGAFNQAGIMVSPSAPVAARGDTVLFDINVADNGLLEDMIVFNVKIDTTFWSVPDTASPYSLSLSGVTMQVNEVSESGGYYNVRGAIFDGTSDFGSAINTPDIDNTGYGTTVAQLELVCKGTDAAVEEITMLELDEAELRLNGSVRNVPVHNGRATIKPRAVLDAVVDFEGRPIDAGYQVTVELRKVGSYEDIEDNWFHMANDEDSSATGVQVTLGSNGTIELMEVPEGNYDVVVKYNRYLSVKHEIYFGAGLDTLSSNWYLLGGDCAGYTDSLGNTMPNNAVNQEDVNRISAAWGADSSHANWGAPSNYKWADINEDGSVELEDLKLVNNNFDATASTISQGAQPVFLKQAADATNDAVQVKLVDVPSEVVAGETYTVKLEITGAGEVGGYFANFAFDPSTFSFSSIQNGGFLNGTLTQVRDIEETTAGLAAVTQNHRVFAGDGVVAEVTFKANRSTSISEDMLSLDMLKLITDDYTVTEFNQSMVTVVSNEEPVAFGLSQNSPNPFNPTTTINFSVADNSHVTIKVYDVLGRHVTTLVDRGYTPGHHQVVWNGTDVGGNLVSNGIYFYRIDAGSFHDTKKMLFLK
jgi:hypothetical protein